MQNNAALITGGGVRLGKLISLSLANVGWDIAIHYNNSEDEAIQTQKEIQNLGRRCEIFKFDFNLTSQVNLIDPVDLKDPKDLKDIEEQYDNFLIKVKSIFPNLTLLINNAAFYKASNIENCKLSDYDKLMNINLKAPIFLSKAFYKITIKDSKAISLDSPEIEINDSKAISPDSPEIEINDNKAITPENIKNKSKTLLSEKTLIEKSTPSTGEKFSENFHNNKNFNIINILDTKINSNTFPYFAYVLTKKALGEFTKMAALEFEKKVRVNAIAPNMVIPIEDHERTSEYLNWMKEAIPLKSFPKFENIFLSIKYLLENKYVTGEILHVDGGEGINFITRNFESFKNKK